MEQEEPRQGFLEAILHEPDVEDHRLIFHISTRPQCIGSFQARLGGV